MDRIKKKSDKVSAKEDKVSAKRGAQQHAVRSSDSILI